MDDWRVVSDVWSSIVVLCRRVITDATFDVEFIDWDAHADIAELPNKDLLGPSAFSIDEVEKDTFVVSFAVGISTYQDKNLFRLRELAGRLFSVLRVGKSIGVYDTETSEQARYMVIRDGVTLTPITRAEVRTLQFVQVECLFIDTYRSPLRYEMISTPPAVEAAPVITSKTNPTISVIDIHGDKLEFQLGGAGD